MKARLRPVLVVGATAALGLAVLSAQQQAPPPFRAGVDVVEFEASVLDANREPIRGLKPENFQVFEAGKLQPIIAFSEVVLPESDGPRPSTPDGIAPDVTQPRYADRRLFAIILDDFGTPQTALQLILDNKKIAKLIVDEMGPMDFAAIVLTRDIRYFPDFTSDAWKLRGYIEAFKPVLPAEKAWLSMITRGRIGAIFALKDVIAYLSRLPQHRKTIIFVHGGIGGNLTGSINITRDRVIDIIRDASAAGIAISSIDPHGLETPFRGNAAQSRSVALGAGNGGRPMLQTLAENTGGYAAPPSNDFQPGLEQMFRETQSYYLIGYRRTSPNDGQLRRLEVRLNRPGLTAYTRSGVKAPGKPDMVKAEPPPFDAGVEDAMEAMTRAAAVRPLYVYAVELNARLHVVAELGTAEMAARHWPDGADVIATVTRGAGGLVTTARGRIAAGTRGVGLDVPLVDANGQAVDLASRPFHVSVEASDRGGRHGEDGADAKPPGAVLGEPLVYRAGSSPRAPLQAVGEFQFARTERLHVVFPAVKDVTARRARLLRKNGEALTVEPVVSDATIDGQAVVAVDLNLAFLTIGDYALDLSAEAGADGERKVVAFRVR